jgi:hypothetical protein
VLGCWAKEPASAKDLQHLVLLRRTCTQASHSCLNTPGTKSTLGLADRFLIGNDSDCYYGPKTQNQTKPQEYQQCPAQAHSDLGKTTCKMYIIDSIGYRI